VASEDAVAASATPRPRPKPKPVNRLKKALKHHPDAPTDDDYNYHYGKRKDWDKRLTELEARRSPVALAAAGEGVRRLSLTPSQPPIASQNPTRQLTAQATTTTTSRVSVPNATPNISEADATRVGANVALHPQPNASQNPTRQLTAQATTTTTSRVSVPNATPNISRLTAQATTTTTSRVSIPNATPNISEADATRVSANVPQPNASQNPTRWLAAQATTTTTSRVSVPNATPNISAVDATPRASANVALRLQPNASSQDPEDPMKRLCDLAFVNYLLQQYGFDEAQRRALFRYI